MPFSDDKYHPSITAVWDVGVYDSVKSCTIYVTD